MLASSRRLFSVQTGRSCAEPDISPGLFVAGCRTASQFSDTVSIPRKPMSHSAHGPAVHDAVGRTIHGAARYDLLVALLTLGGERRLREKILDLADLRPGEQVLDIGCGTGSLALLAKRRVGASGSVHGLDPSPQMLDRAAAKARRAGIELSLAQGAVQAMPYSDASFDVVISTFMLHHVPAPARRTMAHEIRRVLKPDGRALLVDFGPPDPSRRSAIDHFHRHGFVRIDEIVADLKDAGFDTASGPVGAKGLYFVVAGAMQTVAVRQAAQVRPGSHGHTAIVAGFALLTLGGLVVLHVGAAMSLWRMPHALPPSLTAALVGAIVLVVVAKLTLFGIVHRFAGRLIERWVRVGHGQDPGAS
jgi:ubiquinone/menaquinone biosynthesis C-methylase UbiE